jgi:hypothetical protein
MLHTVESRKECDLWVTQLATEMGIRDISWGWKWPVYMDDNLAIIKCWLSRNSRSLNILKPWRLLPNNPSFVSNIHVFTWCGSSQVQQMASWNFKRFLSSTRQLTSAMIIRSIIYWPSCHGYYHTLLVLG